MPAAQLAIHFFLQFAAILFACRVVGSVARRFGQPQVVGEMIAGVCLGPSLLGLFAPQVQLWLFPKLLLQAGQPVLIDGAPLQHPLMTVLYCIAQLGLVLNMFCVGTEFDAGLLRSRARAALCVSLAGILAPFLLGGLIAWMYRENASFFAPGVSLGERILFIGAAMSITAFPMLARIIHERVAMGVVFSAGSAADRRSGRRCPAACTVRRCPDRVCSRPDA